MRGDFRQSRTRSYFQHDRDGRSRGATWHASPFLRYSRHFCARLRSEFEGHCADRFRCRSSRNGDRRQRRFPHSTRPVPSWRKERPSALAFLRPPGRDRRPKGRRRSQPDRPRSGVGGRPERRRKRPVQRAGARREGGGVAAERRRRLATRLRRTVSIASRRRQGACREAQSTTRLS